MDDQRPQLSPREQDTPIERDEWDGKPWNHALCECTAWTSVASRLENVKVENNLLLQHAKRVWPDYVSFRFEEDLGRDGHGLWKRVKPGEDNVLLFRYRLEAHKADAEDFATAQPETLLLGEAANKKSLAWLSVWNVVSTLRDNCNGPRPVVLMDSMVYTNVCTCCGAKRNEGSWVELRTPDEADAKIMNGRPF